MIEAIVALHDVGVGAHVWSSTMPDWHVRALPLDTTTALPYMSLPAIVYFVGSDCEARCYTM